MTRVLLLLILIGSATAAGAAVYRIPMAVMPRMAECNKTLDAPGRHYAVMAAEALYAVE